MSRFFILTTLFLSFHLQILSQNNDLPFGHYYDADQNLLIDYVDTDYDPATSLVESYNQTYSYRYGYYYDLDSNKIEKDIYGSNFLGSFSYDVPDKKRDKSISADECLGFVIAEDSFTVMRNFKVATKMGELSVSEYRFLNVIDHIPGYTFYQYQSSDFLYQPEKNSLPVPFPKSKKKLALFCQEYFSEFPIIINQIAKEKITDDNVNEIIRMIDYQVRHNKGLKIYFDQYWNEQKNEKDHYYYAIVDDIKDDIWYLTYYDQHGTKIMTGGFSSLSSMKREGSFTWFNKNGMQRKSNTYVDGELKSQKHFYDDGSLHYSMEMDDQTWKYSEVYDRQKKQILNSQGSGTELYLDQTNQREIKKVYSNHFLISASYVNSQGHEIFQVAEKNAKIKSLKSRITEFSTQFEYEREWAEDRLQGNYLIRLIINPNGNIIDFEILHSVDEKMDRQVIYATQMILYKEYPVWKTAKMGKDDVFAEVVLPINFKIVNFYNTYYNHNPFWMHHHHMMMMQMNLNHVSPPTMPAGF